MSEILGVMYKNHWEEVQVRGVVHEGKDYLDLRVFQLTEGGKGGADAKPTARGVTVHLSLLPELIQALEQARPYYETRQAAALSAGQHTRRLQERGPGRANAERYGQGGGE